MTAYFWILASIWAVDLLALMSPGPNFLMVSQTAMRRSRGCALMVALGIASGSALWGAAVALGLSALFAAVPWLHTALKIGGAAYLVHLGIGFWRTGNTGERPPAVAPEASSSRAYLRGVTTNILNPKSAAYYGSVFALFFAPGMPGWLQAAAIALISLSSVLWHAVLAVLFSTAGIRRAYGGARRVVSRVAGALMIALGARLLLARD